MLETFDAENNETFTENNYYLTDEEGGTDQVLIDFSCAYDDIDIKFNKLVTNVSNTSLTGFKKYRVFSAPNHDVYFKVVNPNNRSKANYMIRYYYTGLGAEYNYSLSSSPINLNITLYNETADINITYNSINITKGIKPRVVKNNTTYFYIY